MERAETREYQLKAAIRELPRSDVRSKEAILELAELLDATVWFKLEAFKLQKPLYCM